MQKARFELSEALQLTVILEGKSHLVSRHAVPIAVSNMFETLANRVRGYIDSAHDVTEAAKTLYRSLAATVRQNF